MKSTKNNIRDIQSCAWYDATNNIDVWICDRAMSSLKDVVELKLNIFTMIMAPTPNAPLYYNQIYEDIDSQS